MRTTLRRLLNRCLALADTRLCLTPACWHLAPARHDRCPQCEASQRKATEHRAATIGAIHAQCRAILAECGPRGKAAVCCTLGCIWPADVTALAGSLRACGQADLDHLATRLHELAITLGHELLAAEAEQDPYELELARETARCQLETERAERLTTLLAAITRLRDREAAAGVAPEDRLAVFGDQGLYDREELEIRSFGRPLDCLDAELDRIERLAARCGAN